MTRFEHQKTFSLDLHDLQSITSWIQEFLNGRFLDHKDQMHIELAFEEALVNIANHAYQGEPGLVELAIAIDSNITTIAIRDFGPPFDPLTQAPKVDVEIPLEEREVGGLGLYLIRQVMDEVLYKREKNSNLLTMRKKIRHVL